MVKEKELNIIIEPNPRYLYFSMAYNTNSGNIKIPKMGWMYYDGKNPLSESLINLPYLIRSFSHEYLHKIIHEMEGIKACKMLDNLDIEVDERGMRSFKKDAIS